MELLMKWNKEIILQAKDHIKDLFIACDLNFKGYIEILEFFTIVNSIDPYKFTFDEIYNFFSQYSNNYDIV